MGEIEKFENHLASGDGCDYELVQCPNKCQETYALSTSGTEEQTAVKSKNMSTTRQRVKKMKRKDLENHRKNCELRSYKCQFCGLEDTYRNIAIEYPYAYTFHGREEGKPVQTATVIKVTHYDKCEEYPVQCPNNCGAKVKRKIMKDIVASARRSEFNVSLDVKRSLYVVNWSSTCQPPSHNTY